MISRLHGKRLTRLGALLLTWAATCIHGQDPLRTLPENYHLIYENEYVRAIHVIYRAHEKLPVHDHSDKPTIYVYLTDSGPVRFSHIEEHAFSLIRQPEKAGTFRLSPGRLEKHTVENLGDIATEFLRVELKTVPLGFQAASFRSSKSFDVSYSHVSTEFPGLFVRISRIIAAGSEATEVKGLDDPALLVLFTPAVLRQGDSTERSQKVSGGNVLWIKPHQPLHIAGTGEKTAANLVQTHACSELGASEA